MYTCECVCVCLFIGHLEWNFIKKLANQNSTGVQFEPSGRVGRERKRERERGRERESVCEREYSHYL